LKIRSLGFDRNELVGAFGDHGTFIPLVTLTKANGFTVLNEGATVKKGDELTVTLFSEKELLQL